LIDLIRAFLSSFGTTRANNLNFAIVSFCFASILAFMSYTNISFLTDRRNIARYLQLNIWFNFFHIFYLSLVGFTVYVFIGLKFIPYMLYDKSIDFGMHVELFDVRFNISYESSNEIGVGINLPLLLIFISLNQIDNAKNADVDPPFAQQIDPLKLTARKMHGKSCFLMLF